MCECSKQQKETTGEEEWNAPVTTASVQKAVDLAWTVSQNNLPHDELSWKKATMDEMRS